MKRAVAASLALLILFSLCACATDEGASISQSSASSSSAQSDSESASGISAEISCPVFFDLAEMGKLRNGSVRQYPCGDLSNYLKENSLWMPPFDNEISVDEAYDGIAVSEQKAWASHQIATSGEPCYAYASYEPELTFLRKIDETHCYAVYNVDSGGKLYIFYTPWKSNGLTTYKDYLRLYVTDRLSYSDFSGIKIGDRIDKVIAVDRSAQQVQKNGDLFGAIKVSFHLLTDGLLTIKYEDRGELFVKEVIFSKDYTFNHFSLFEMTETDIALLERHQLYPEQYIMVKILPQDYPQ